MQYNVAAVAGALAQLCAALAGFSIVAINIVIDKDSIKDKLALAPLIRLTYLSFFGLIISAILHGIRSGEMGMSNSTWILTIWGNFATVSAMLMLFYALFMLTAVNLSNADNDHLFDRLFSVASSAMLFWQIGSMAGFWKEIGHVGDFVIIGGIGITISLIVAFLPRIQWLSLHIQDEQTFWYYLGVLFIPCVFFLAVWLYPDAISLDIQMLLQLAIMPALWGLILLLKHERLNETVSL
jgi:hypothetical protein